MRMLKYWKYDCIALLRKILPVIVLYLLICIYVSLRTRNVAPEEAYRFAGMTALWGFAYAAVIAVTIIMTILRFSESMYKEEASFTMSLPLSTLELVGEKFLLALSSVLILTFIELISSVLFEDLNVIYGPLVYTGEIMAELMQITMVFAAVSLGRLWKKHPVIGAFLAFILLAVIYSALMRNIHVDSLAMYFNHDYGSGEFIFMVIQLLIYFAVIWYMTDQRTEL